MFRQAAKNVLREVRAQTEAESAAHRLLREEVDKKANEHENLPGFMEVGKTGVIYVMARATALGFSYENPDWANFGQGAPETGELEGQPERHFTVEFNAFNNEYAPVAGIVSLRQQVADLYNARYRVGKSSQYTYKNVCICPGGRAALSRVAASAGQVNVGYFLPDYTAYEQILSVFKNMIPIPNILDASTGYKLSYEKVQDEIETRGLQIVLYSNPGNPTGALTEKQDLGKIVQVAREGHCSFIIDEFYSAYIYTNTEEEKGRTVSAAEYIEDVNTDPVLIIDGLTKNWRLPGWRVCWAIGPEDIIEGMASTGSFLDGGASHILQDTVARSNILDYEFAKQDAIVLQEHFKMKRDFVSGRLHKMGFKIDAEPNGTFYLWANLEDLPPPLNNGMQFFEAALSYKVICVPGIFFDINPGKRRELFRSPFHHYVRFSVGPPLDVLTKGLDHLEELLQAFRTKVLVSSCDRIRSGPPTPASTSPELEHHDTHHGSHLATHHGHHVPPTDHNY